MTKISNTDIIFATVTAGGRQISNLRLSGFTSLQQLMCHIISTIGRQMGLITLQLRNLTQGWTSRQAVRLA